MVDLVGTCPKGFWEEWIAEGDAAGEPESGQEWGWFTRDELARAIAPGERFYVVAHGRLRGWAPVSRLIKPGDPDRPPTARWTYAICRRAGAVACTIDEPIPGFRGLRKRWWDRAIERPFPDWKRP